MANRPSRLEAALSSIGSTAERYSQGLEQDRLRQRQREEQERQMAAQRAQIIQQRVPGLMASKQWDALAGLQGQYADAMKKAYDINLPAPAVGAPIYGPGAKPIITRGEPFRPMPPEKPVAPGAALGAPPSFVDSGSLSPVYTPTTITPPPEIRRDFSGAQSIQAMRNLFAPAPPRLQPVGGVLYNQETGEFIVPPTAQTPETRMELESARIRGRLENTRLRGIYNLKGKEIGAQASLGAAQARAGATLGAAQIGAQTRMSIAQMGVQQKEQDRALKAGIAADNFELKNKAIDVRRQLGLDRINAQERAKIIASATGAYENVTNDLLQNKIEAAVKNVPGEDGLPNYVMSFDNETARAKAVLSAESNGFFVSDGGTPNTIVLTPQPGMSNRRGLMASVDKQGKPVMVQRRAGVPKYERPRAAVMPGGRRGPAASKQLSPTQKQVEAVNYADIEYSEIIKRTTDEAKRKKLANEYMQFKTNPRFPGATPAQWEELRLKKLRELSRQPAPIPAAQSGPEINSQGEINDSAFSVIKPKPQRSR